MPGHTSRFVRPRNGNNNSSGWNCAESVARGMINDMRQQGFSLMEVGVAVSIVAMLTSVTLGAANMVRENSLAEEMRNMAKTMQTAVENFRGYHGYTVRFSGNETSSSMPSYWFTTFEMTQTDKVVALPPVGGFATYLFTNPYTGNWQSIWQVISTSDGGLPVGSVTGVTYSSAAYPLTNVGGNNLIGRVLYFAKGNGSTAQRSWGSLRVWNGVANVYFREYAVQAIDGKGYPVCTIGL